MLNKTWLVHVVVPLLPSLCCSCSVQQVKGKVLIKTDIAAPCAASDSPVEKYHEKCGSPLYERALLIAASINVLLNLASENIPWNNLFDGKWLFWQKSLCKTCEHTFHCIFWPKTEGKCFRNYQQTRAFSIVFQWWEMMIKEKIKQVSKLEFFS